MRQALRIGAVLAVAGVVTTLIAGSGTAATVDAQADSAPAQTAAVQTAAVQTAAVQTAAVQGQDEHADTVYVIGTAKDGSTTVTIYDPAEGVSPDQLRDMLRRSGVTGVLAKGVQPPSAQPNQTAAAAACLSYGSAREWCNHRWSYGGFNDPQVYFLDHTSSRWPVTAAVADWYKAVGIDAYYRWYTQGCPSGRHCVNVHNGNYGASGWYGLTTWNPGTQGPVTVKLNDHYSLTANQHRTIACHELGHALSLDHATSTSSCLYSGKYISLHPSSNDYSLLPRIYPKPGT